VNDPFSSMGTFTTVQLKRLDFYVQCHLPPAVARSVRCDSYLLPMMEGVVLQLRAFVLGETVPEVDVTYPSTWWDAVKDRWFPSWSRQWFPVEYRRIKVDKHTLFPSIEIPRHEAVVTIGYSDYSWTDFGKDAE
jgi:hypothetical protein